MLLGLRLENTQITIDQITTNNLAKKNYTNLFPTVNLGYEFTESSSATLGYNRRIRRPRSRFINPFPSRSSETNLFQGNPDLDPVFSDGVDLGYLKRWKGFTLNTSIYYTRSTDVFEFISEDTGQVTNNGDAVVRRFPVNLSSNDRYGFELTLMYKPAKWWAPIIAAAKISMGIAVDCIPTPKPAIIFVAGPVRDCLVIDNTGDVPVPV